MAKLGVNIDHVATVREARKGECPDPVEAAMLAEQAGAHGITCHLREDRRHVQERDVRLLRAMVKTHLNLEMAATNEMVQVAIDVLPDQATLVPEKRAELTTEGGLDVVAAEKEVAHAVGALQRNNVVVSLFVDPDLKQLKAARRTGATAVEIHTGQYANAAGDKQSEEFYRIAESVMAAHKLGLRVHAGHGLDYQNVTRIAQIETVIELNIGHSIMARSMLVGMDTAVRDMLKLVV